MRGVRRPSCHAQLPACPPACPPARPPPPPSPTHTLWRAAGLGAGQSGQCTRGRDVRRRLVPVDGAIQRQRQGGWRQGQAWAACRRRPARALGGCCQLPSPAALPAGVGAIPSTTTCPQRSLERMLIQLRRCQVVVHNHRLQANVACVCVGSVCVCVCVWVGGWEGAVEGAAGSFVVWANPTAVHQAHNPQRRVTCTCTQKMYV